MAKELGETKAEQLAAWLRRQIERGELRPGDIVPSQTVLIREHGLSSTTIREAMSALAVEGWIERSQGRATRVARRPRPTRLTAALVLAGNENPFYAELLRSIQFAAAEANIRLLLTLQHAAHKRLTEEMERLGSEDVRAALVSPVPHERRVAQLQRSNVGGVRLVAFGAREPLSLDAVTVNRAVGVELAVRHLHELGHRRMVLLSGETSTGPWSRLLGLERARAALGLSPAECYRFDGGPDEALPEAATALLDLPHPPTAVICSSDRPAVQLVRVAQARGLRVPEDLSVVGFAASAWGAEAAVPLTSVSYRTPLLGAAIVHLLQRALTADAAAPPETTVIEPELIVRASTADRPAREQR